MFDEQVGVDISLAAKDATREIQALMLTNERKMKANGRGEGDSYTTGTLNNFPPPPGAPATRHTDHDVVMEDEGGGGGGGGGATFIFRVRSSRSTTEESKHWHSAH